MSETIFQNSGCVNTVLGSLNHLNAFLPLQYKANNGTTLNAKYRVLPTCGPIAIPKLLYFGIGNNGYSCASSNNGKSLHVKHQPDCRNMDLYSPIPFRVRPLSEDLSVTERSKYRMRVVKTVGTTKYAFYYLKLIDWNTTEDEPRVEVVVYKSNGTEVPYAFNNGYLTPIVPSASTTGGAIDATDRIVVRAVGICNVEPEELREYMELEGADYCEISEFGFYTGIDVCVRESGDADNPTLEIIEDVTSDESEYPEDTIKEAAYVQLAKHKTQLPVTLSGEGSSLETRISIEESNSVSI